MIDSYIIAWCYYINPEARNHVIKDVKHTLICTGLVICLSHSLVENQNDLELDFKVLFFADSCCSDIVLDESN